MEPEHCMKIQSNKTRCTKPVTGEQHILCKFHETHSRKKGPGHHGFNLIRARYEFLRHSETLRARAEDNPQHIVINDHRLTLRQLKLDFDRNYDRFTQTEDGVLYIAEKGAIDRERQVRHDLFMAQRLHNQELVQDMAAQFGGAVRIAPPPAAQGRLAFIATDNQGVHTSEAVRLVKQNVDHIMDISVPPEYRWNLLTLSKTPGEIIAECRLTQHAGCQMLTQYCSNVAIYDICPGVYGKVLDGVWQIIKNSEDSVALKQVVKQELEDNIGMCAQGNLTRIVNIVNGLVEGLKQYESIGDVLGRLLPPLTEISDLKERWLQTLFILKDNNVPLSDWFPWVESLDLEDHYYKFIKRVSPQEGQDLD